MSSNYEFILVETRGDGPRKTGLVTLNRPKQLNALNDALMDELGAALVAFDADDGIGCIVVTGSDKAFAAGADIGAMANSNYMDMVRGNFITRNWETIRSVRMPVIAAVSAAVPPPCSSRACRHACYAAPSTETVSRPCP